MRTSQIYLSSITRSGIAAAMLACLCMFTITTISSSNADATQRVSVVALVNGEPITSLDLENRMKFLRTLSKLEMDEADFRADTLQKLVSEKIKIQAAEEQLGSVISEATNTARQLIDQNFKNGDKPGGQVLKERGAAAAARAENIACSGRVEAAAMTAATARAAARVVNSRCEVLAQLAR